MRRFFVCLLFLSLSASAAADAEAKSLAEAKSKPVQITPVAYRKAPAAGGLKQGCCSIDEQYCDVHWHGGRVRRGRAIRWLATL